MSLAFLGGLASTYNGAVKGYRDAEDRDQVLEDRAYQKEQRGIQRGQQERQLREQARDDQFREGLAGVRTADQISEAAVGTINGKDAPVLRDDEGSLMPGAVETKPAQTTARKRNRDDIMADYAEVARKAGKMDEALKFEDMAAAESMRRGKALFSQWSASTPDTASLEDAVNQAAQIYNGDRLPGQVQGYKMNPDGSATVVIKNTASGQAMPVTFKSVAELKQGLEGYYSQDTLDAYRKSLRDSRIKREEKEWEFRNDPTKRFIKKGDNQEVIDSVTGKTVAPATRQASGTPVYDEDGNITGYTGGVRSGSGTRSTKAGDPDKALSDTLDFIAKNSTLQNSPPEVTARVQQYAFQVLQNSGGKIPPQLAGSIAIDAAMNPAKLQPRIDIATGSIDMAYESPDVGEIKFTRGYATPQQPANLTAEQFKGFASKLVEAQPPAVRDKFVAAAFDGKARADLEGGVRGEIVKMYEKQIAANPQARDQLIALRDATIASSMESLERKFNIVNAHYPKPKATEEKPLVAASDRLKSGGGMVYTPPPGSRVAQMRDQNNAIAEKRKADDAARDAANAARSREIAPTVRQIISSKDVAAAAKLQSSVDFSLLPKDQQIAIWKIVNGQ